MADEGDFDPNADVPLWVNIVVPILCGIVFTIVVVLLYRTEKEIALDTLIDWANRIPVLNKWLLPDDPGRVENKLARNRNVATSNGNVATSNRPVTQTERSYLNSGYNIERYDTISSITTQDTLGSVSDYSSRHSYYASRGTLVNFETNV